MNFTYREIIKESWRALKDNISIWILIMLFMLFLNLLISSIQEQMLGQLSLRGIIFIIASYLFQAGISLGLVSLALNIYRGEAVSFSQIFENFHLLFRYIIATIASFIILFFASLPGLLLLLFSTDGGILSVGGALSGIFMAISIIITVAPVIYGSIRLQLYHYYLVDQKSSPIGSIKNSIRATKGSEMELFILGASLSLIILVSMIPMLLGLFISIPLASMANAKVYLVLKSNS